MRDLVFSAVIAAFIFYGFRAPFVMLLGYVWVDVFSPQTLAYGFLTRLPLSAIMAGLTVLSLVYANERRKKNDEKTVPVLSDFRPWMLLLFAGWMTLTTVWSEFPKEAWAKWDWAFKSVIFALIVPFSIKSRSQIEALVLVIITALSGDIFARGAKAILSGGGYGHDQGLQQGNSRLAEGSTFALVAISLVPLVAYFSRNSRLFSGWYVRVAVVFGIVCCFMGAFGTYERTAVVTAAGLALFAIYGQRTRPFRLLACLAGLAVAISFVPALLGDAWVQRMHTTLDAKESSSATRLVVWEWTIKYANAHPWGGGFDVYLRNGIETGLGESRAFHSMWFEVLGEQGWVGLVTFVLLILTSLLSLAGIARAAKADPNLSWLNKLASALFVTISIYCLGASFVGIAYQSLLWYYLMLSVTLSLYLRKVRATSSTTQAAGPKAPSRWAVGGRSEPRLAGWPATKMGGRQPRWSRKS